MTKMCKFFCYQVQWDEPSSVLRPDTVSPWELEPLVAATPSNSQPPQRNKRARVLPTQTTDIPTLGTNLVAFTVYRLCFISIFT